jgi:hypothetical protein
MGFPADAPIEEGVGSMTPESEVKEQMSVGHRDGAYAARSFEVGRNFSGRTYGSADIDNFSVGLVLYRHQSSDAEAERAWLKEPPELVQHETLNLAGHSEAWIAANLDSWYFGGSDEPPRWTGVCLAGSAEHCAGFHGWFHLCELTLEIQVGATGGSTDNPEIQAFMEAVALAVVNDPSAEAMTACLR